MYHGNERLFSDWITSGGPNTELFIDNTVFTTKTSKFQLNHYFIFMNNVQITFFHQRCEKQDNFKFTIYSLSIKSLKWNKNTLRLRNFYHYLSIINFLFIIIASKLQQRLIIATHVSTYYNLTFTNLDDNLSLQRNKLFTSDRKICRFVLFIWG